MHNFINNINFRLVNSRIRDYPGIPEKEGDLTTPCGGNHHVLGDESLRRDSRTASLHIHRTLSELENREAAWRALERAESDPFQTFSWCHSFYSAYEGTIGAPLVFELRVTGESRAFLPCFIEGATVRLAGEGIGLITEVIADDLDSVFTLLHAAMGWLANEDGLSQFHFETIRESGLLNQAIQLVEKSGGESHVNELALTTCGSVEFGAGLRSYFGGLSEDCRKTEVTAFQNLEKMMPFSRDTVLCDFQIRVDDLVNAGRFHFENDLSGTENPFDDESSFDFFGRITKDPDLGFRLGFLTCQGDLLAVEFGFLRSDTYHVYLTQDESARESLAPSKYLLQRRLDSLSLAGVKRIVYHGTVGSDRSTLSCNHRETFRSLQWMPVRVRNRSRRFGLQSLRHLRNHFKKMAHENDATLAR